jgi:hypothetical protein
MGAKRKLWAIFKKLLVIPFKGCHYKFADMVKVGLCVRVRNWQTDVLAFAVGVVAYPAVFLLIEPRADVIEVNDCVAVAGKREPEEVLLLHGCKNFEVRN